MKRQLREVSEKLSALLRTRFFVVNIRKSDQNCELVQ